MIIIRGRRSTKVLHTRDTSATATIVVAANNCCRIAHRLCQVSSASKGTGAARQPSNEDIFRVAQASCELWIRHVQDIR